MAAILLIFGGLAGTIASLVSWFALDASLTFMIAAYFSAAFLVAAITCIGLVSRSVMARNVQEPQAALR